MGGITTKKTNSISTELIKNALIYVDGFAYPEKIEEESEDLLVVVPKGSTLRGDVKYYIKIHSESVEVYTSAIFRELEVNHRFFSEVKSLCIANKIEFNSDVDRGVTLSFKQKILTNKDIRTFILKVYDLGRILEKSSDIFRNQPDLVKKYYKQVFLRIGPYEKGVILDKEADAFISCEPFSAEFATIPDKDGFFEIQLGSTVLIIEGEAAHESIPPYFILVGGNLKLAQNIFLPWAIIDWNKVGAPSVPAMWDGCSREESELKGVRWKNISTIVVGMERIINILNSIKRSDREIPSPTSEDIEFAVGELERFKNNEYLFSALKNNEFYLVLEEIRFFFEDFLGLRWNVNTHSLTWIKRYEISTLEDYLAPEQEEEIINAANDLYKSTYEILIGLKWAGRFLNKIVLWLASIHAKENMKDQNLYFPSIIDENVITTKDIMKGGSLKAKEFLSSIFGKARFICPTCGDSIPRLNIYKTRQGFIFSCPKCRSKLVRPNFDLKATVTQNVFVIDTSAVIKGIASELVTQGILDKPLFIVPKAVEFELQRLIKGPKRNKGKKGLNELMKLRELDNEKRIYFKIEGNIPRAMIEMSKEWKIGLDSLVIEKAKEYTGTIITCDDEDLAPLSIAEGIRTLVYKS